MSCYESVGKTDQPRSRVVGDSDVGKEAADIFEPVRERLALQEVVRALLFFKIIISILKKDPLFAGQHLEDPFLAEETSTM